MLYQGFHEHFLRPPQEGRKRNVTPILFLSLDMSKNSTKRSTAWTYDRLWGTLGATYDVKFIS